MRMFSGSDIKEEELAGSLFMTYQPRLVAYARRFVTSTVEAEDLVQDSFVNYWCGHYSPASEAEASKLLFTITRNKCLNYLKKKKPEYIKALDSEDILGDELFYNWDFHYPDGERDCLLKELNVQIKCVIESLPPKCRVVFEMSRIQNLSNKEIAEKLGISHTAVEKHLRRALSAFRESLKDNTSILFHLFVLAVTGQFLN